ncbi:MAG: hypothetical protein KIT87_08510 [Anaerolineae bacterium]|nr:hypothetical protein [Anaerolineae bacterium]
MRRPTLILMLSAALVAVHFLIIHYPAAADETTLPRADAGRPAIILLPGVASSRLTNAPSTAAGCGRRTAGEVWPNLGGLLGFRYNQSLMTLALAEDGARPADGCDHVQPSGVITRIDILGLPVAHIYDGFMDEMRRLGYEVYPFDYDWRLDLEASAVRLDALIQRLHAPRVVLVGHSMGGLVARQYVTRPERVARVERVITVGTPYWGAPAAAEQMRNGQAGVVFDPILDDTNVWTIIRNAPGPLYLLPSEAFFQAGLPSHYFIDTDRPLTSYSATTRFFAERGQNSALLDAARRRHATLDRFDPTLSWSPGFYHALVGRRLPTPRLIREYPCAGGQPTTTGPNRCVEERGYEAGDGTVPWTSAGLPAQSGNVSLCIYDTATPHAALMVDSAVLADIRQIIEGKATLTCRPPRAAKASPLPDFIEVAVEGEARVTVTDTRSRVAQVVEPGYIRNDIPGALYRASAGRTVVLLPTDAPYQLALQPRTKEPLQVRVTRFTMPASTQLAQIVEQAVFVDVLTTVGKATRLSLDPTVGLPDLRLAVDLDLQGKARLTEPPSSVLDATASSDLTLPVTSIQLEHSPTGHAMVTLTARDEGTGILKTEYSFDGGQSWTLYGGPFPLDPSQTSTLQARSTDRAGNHEYPWSTMSLR